MMNLVPIIILPLIPNNSCGSAPKETEIKNGWIQLEYKMSQIANVRMKIWVDLHRLFLINITKITHRFASTEIVTEIVLGISHSSKKKIIIHQRKCFFFCNFWSHWLFLHECSTPTFSRQSQYHFLQYSFSILWSKQFINMKYLRKRTWYLSFSISFHKYYTFIFS